MEHRALRLTGLAAVTAALALTALGPASAETTDPPLEVPPVDAPAPDAGALFDEAFFLTLGFSFLVGLAVGFALKVAFKIALVVFGVMFLGVFVLQYAGLVDVNWTGVETHYDTWAQWLSVHLSAVLDFMGDNLSSGASFLGGLALGLRL